MKIKLISKDGLSKKMEVITGAKVVRTYTGMELRGIGFPDWSHTYRRYEATEQKNKSGRWIFKEV